VRGDDDSVFGRPGWTSNETGQLTDFRIQVTRPRI